jgi:hypothetical protein
MFADNGYDWIAASFDRVFGDVPDERLSLKQSELFKLSEASRTPGGEDDGSDSHQNYAASPPAVCAIA